MTLEAGIATVDVYGSADFSEAMQRVDTSVLIMQGDQERSFASEMGLQLKHALPHAALFNQVVTDFLRQAPAPAAAAQSASPARKGLAV